MYFLSFCCNVDPYFVLFLIHLIDNSLLVFFCLKHWRILTYKNTPEPSSFMLVYIYWYQHVLVKNEMGGE